MQIAVSHLRWVTQGLRKGVVIVEEPLFMNCVPIFACGALGGFLLWELIPRTDANERVG